MTGKVSVTAPANIAFIKYWGIRDVDRVLPCNRSISMTLTRCVSHTTVEVLEGDSDEVLWAGQGADLEPAEPRFARGVERHLERIRTATGRLQRMRVATRNSFPSGAGMASSASGFAALAIAASRALDLDSNTAELSVLARLSGSGSAARSVLGGYVEWPAGEAEGEDDGSAKRIAQPEHWDLRDLVAVIDRRQKTVSSRQGHARAIASPYFEQRQRLLVERLAEVRRAIAERSFERLAPVVEEEAIDLHLIAMSSRPPIFYWRPGTLEVLEAARDLRRAGIEVCATMDAGANVHLICTAAAEEQVRAELERLPAVLEVIADRVGKGPREVEEHLF